MLSGFLTHVHSKVPATLFNSPLALSSLLILSFYQGMGGCIGAPEILTCCEGDNSERPDLRILHFNDVYHIEPSSHGPAGGVSRFQTICKYYQQDLRFQGQSDLITLFSGDGFNPSLESSVTKGLYKDHWKGAAELMNIPRQPHGPNLEWHSDSCCLCWRKSSFRTFYAVILVKRLLKRCKKLLSIYLHKVPRRKETLVQL